MTKGFAVGLVFIMALVSQAPPSDQWSLVVLVDVSESMPTGDTQTGLSLLAKELRSTVRPGESAELAVFASEVRHVVSLDDSVRLERDPLSPATDPAWRYGPSRLWDSLGLVAEKMARTPGRRVILVVSDGKATGNQLGSADVVALMKELRTELWMFSCAAGFGDDRLRTVVSVGGGRVFETQGAGQRDCWNRLPTAAADAIRLLRTEVTQ